MLLVALVPLLLGGCPNTNKNQKPEKESSSQREEQLGRQIEFQEEYAESRIKDELQDLLPDGVDCPDCSAEEIIDNAKYVILPKEFIGNTKQLMAAMDEELRLKDPNEHFIREATNALINSGGENRLRMIDDNIALYLLARAVRSGQNSRNTIFTEIASANVHLFLPIEGRNRSREIQVTNQLTACLLSPRLTEAEKETVRALYRNAAKLPASSYGDESGHSLSINSVKLLLNSSDPKNQELALESLARINNAEAVAVLREALSSSNAALYPKICEALGSICQNGSNPHAKAAASILIAIACKSRDAGLREIAAQQITPTEIGEEPPTFVLNSLIRISKTATSPQHRINALEALNHFANDSSTPKLVPSGLIAAFLNDPNPAVRIFAGEKLDLCHDFSSPIGVFHNAENMATIALALRDPEPKVRQLAVRILQGFSLTLKEIHDNPFHASRIIYTESMARPDFIDNLKKTEAALAYALASTAKRGEDDSSLLLATRQTSAVLTGCLSSESEDQHWDKLMQKVGLH